MRAAPQVSVCCTGGRAWRGVQAAVPALAAGVLTYWMLESLRVAGAFDGAAAHAGTLALDVAVLSTALAVTAAVGWSAWSRTAAPPLALQWDGERWRADGAPVAFVLMIDLGHWMLLRLRPDAAGPARWIDATAADAGASWHALRVAAHAPPPPPRALPNAASRAAD